MRYLLFLVALALAGQQFPPVAGGGGASLPSQSGNDGKFLCTDGSNASWCAVILAPYGADFTSQTSVVLTHSYATEDVYPRCIDGNKNPVTPEKTTYDSTSQITVLFNPAQSGRCAVFTNGSGAGGGGGGGAVSSVFGRTGAVAAAANDYAFTDINGTLALNKGGTGATTRAGASAAVLPSYTSNGSKCLAVNTGATDVEWTTCASGGGGGTVDGTSLLGAGTVGDPLHVNPATVPTRITGTGSLSYSTFGGTGNCEEQNITVSGAATGDVATIGPYNTFPAGLIVGAVYVSSTNTVTLRLCRLAGSATISGQTFNAQIVRSF